MIGVSPAHCQMANGIIMMMMSTPPPRSVEFEIQGVLGMDRFVWVPPRVGSTRMVDASCMYLQQCLLCAWLRNTAPPALS